ncbi:MAG: hypothetical protein U0235_11655 [Polyangiaceae bacterium]
MSKRAWLIGWVGCVGVVVACGEQAVDYPNGGNGLGGGDGGLAKPVGAACAKDADCNGLICQDGKCAACTSSAQCKDPTKPVCDTTTGACGGCTSSSQCPDGLACVSGACTSCTSNSQCAAGLVCVNGKCGPCTSTSQCTSPDVCQNGACTSNNDGSTNPTLDGSTGVDACAAGYVGNVGPVGSVWGNASNATPPGFGAAAIGQICKAAGDAACNGAYLGSHACTWEEVKSSDTCGKLAGLKNTTLKAWMHRTGNETASATHLVDDNPSLPPGPAAKGARCNEWTYPTNHAFDGEWIEFGGGQMKAHLDSDTADDNGATSAHAAAGVLQCNGESNFVLCCK